MTIQRYKSLRKQCLMKVSREQKAMPVILYRVPPPAPLTQAHAAGCSSPD